MPALSFYNRYSILDVDSVEDNSTPPSDPADETTIAPDVQLTPMTPSHRVYPPRLKRWERRLLRRYIIASTPSANSLDIKVEIIAMDTQETKSVNALIDCGATGLFIDRDYVHQNQLTARTLSHVIPVYNVDGTPNEAGSIREVVDVILRYQDHSERAHFAVTGLGKQNMILGYLWIREHNPEIDWST
jgi:hypothetical protein